MEINFDLIGLIGGGILTLFNLWYKTSLEKKYKIELNPKKSEDKILDVINFDTQINNKLNSILDEYDADRITILRFHNGGTFYPSSSKFSAMQKSSVAHEVLSPGIDHIMPYQQNILLSAYNIHLTKLMDRGYVNYHNIEDMEDGGLQAMLKQNGVKSYCAIGLMSLNNKFIGILAISYIKNKVKLSEKQLQNMIVKASILSGYLETSISE